MSAAREHSRPTVVERLSVEQMAQVRRLVLAGDFAGGEDEVVATLAEVGLYVLGLDPISHEALCRLSEVVFGANSGFSADLSNGISDTWEDAAAWTRRQRDAEQKAALKAGEGPRA